MVLQHDANKVTTFIRRVIANMVGPAQVADNGLELAHLAGRPPSSMYELRKLLQGAQWLCGGDTGRRCLVVGAGNLGTWWTSAWMALGAMLVCAFCLVTVYATTPKHWIWKPETWPCWRKVGCEPTRFGDESASESSASGTDTG